MRPANERRRHIVTSSLIGWAHTQNDPFLIYRGLEISWELLVRRLTANTNRGPEGCITNVARALQKYYLEIFVLRKLYFWWEFQAETLYACPKPWAHIQSFSLKFSPQMWFLAWYNFTSLFWRARKMLVKHPWCLTITLQLCYRPNGNELDESKMWNPSQPPFWALVQEHCVGTNVTDSTQPILQTDTTHTVVVTSPGLRQYRSY